MNAKVCIKIINLWKIIWRNWIWIILSVCNIMPKNFIFAYKIPDNHSNVFLRDPKETRYFRWVLWSLLRQSPFHNHDERRSLNPYATEFPYNNHYQVDLDREYHHLGHRPRNYHRDLLHKIVLSDIHIYLSKMDYKKCQSSWTFLNNNTWKYRVTGRSIRWHTK